MKPKFSDLLIAFLILITTWKCATISTPEGGPKDVTPPTLLKSNPSQNQKNFKGEAVELTFNEAIKLKDAKEQIIIIPSPGKEVTFTSKGNTVSILPKTGWQDSTTYSISFREGIQDLSEGNPAPNLRLAFSTGPIIDSLIIAGSIKDATTEKIPEDITIALYNQDTFNIFKHTPLYFTKSDKEGKFRLENLKPDNYLIYAFEDKNKNLKVNSPAEPFGFVADTIFLVKNIQGLTIPLIRIDNRELKLTSGRSIEDLATVRFNKSVISYQLTDSIHLKNSYGDNQTEIAIYLDNRVKDSLEINVIAIDSLQQKVDTSFYIKRTPTKRSHDAFRVSFGEPQLDTVQYTFKTTFSTNKILNYLNYDSIYLRLDSALTIPFSKEDFQYDTITKKGTVLKNLSKDSVIINKKFPAKFALGKDFACSIENDSIAPQDLPLKLFPPSETGTLSIDFINKTDNDVIVQLMTSDGKKVVQEITNPKTHVFKDLPPASYKIKLINDSNCNGQWDYGNFLKREEPETISYYIGMDNKIEIPIRANWEVGPLKLISNPPTGRPKDEKPPILVRSIPKQNQINFKDTTIQLTFDEEVQLKNPEKEIIITPSLEEPIKFNSSHKTISLQPKTVWKENTTYRILFREAIQDKRAGNAASNLQLIFSTGPQPDSLSISGTVKSFYSEKNPDNITVALYTSNSFSIFKQTPQYFTKTNSRGEFIIPNLKSQAYFIYAFNDQNKNLIVDKETEAYGFISKSIDLNQKIKDINITLGKLNTTKPRIINTLSTEDLSTLQINKRLYKYEISDSKKISLQNSFGQDLSQILIYLNPSIKDSLKIMLSLTDSLNQKTDTSFFIKKTKTKRNLEPFRVAISEPFIDSATQVLTSNFIFSKKINYITPEKISVKLPNEPSIPFKAEDITIDTALRRGTLHKQINSSVINNKKIPTYLILQNDFICSIENDSIRGARVPVRITANKTGSITTQVKTTQATNYIIQLLTYDNKLVESTSNSTNYSFKNLPFNIYKLRIITDTNLNGKWDPGNFETKQESEPSFFFKTPEGKSAITIESKNPNLTYDITL